MTTANGPHPVQLMAAWLGHERRKIFAPQQPFQAPPGCIRQHAPTQIQSHLGPLPCANKCRRLVERQFGGGGRRASPSSLGPRYRVHGCMPAALLSLHMLPYSAHLFPYSVLVPSKQAGIRALVFSRSTLATSMAPTRHDRLQQTVTVLPLDLSVPDQSCVFVCQGDRAWPE